MFHDFLTSDSSLMSINSNCSIACSSALALVLLFEAQLNCLNLRLSLSLSEN